MDGDVSLTQGVGIIVSLTVSALRSATYFTGFSIQTVRSVLRGHRE